MRMKILIKIPKKVGFCGGAVKRPQGPMVYEHILFSTSESEPSNFYTRRSGVAACHVTVLLRASHFTSLGLSVLAYELRNELRRFFISIPAIYFSLVCLFVF